MTMKLYVTSKAYIKSLDKGESGYGKIKRESNGILTGMMMNKMLYTLGTQTEVVTDQEPLIPI